MKKNVVLLLILSLLLAGCGKNKAQETQPSQEMTEPVAVETTAPDETEVPDTTEETVPGVADSIFDENGDVIETQPEEAPEETQAPTEPTETKPSGGTVPTGPSGGNGNSGNSGNSGNQGESGGLVEPEPPEQPDVTTPPATNPPATQPDEETKPTEPSGGNGGGNNSGTAVQTEYERFHAMSPAEQQAFMESFESIDAFFAWYENAKAEHDAAKPPIDVGDGNIDLDDVIGNG